LDFVTDNVICKDNGLATSRTAFRNIIATVRNIYKFMTYTRAYSSLEAKAAKIVFLIWTIKVTEPRLN